MGFRVGPGFIYFQEVEGVVWTACIKRVIVDYSKDIYVIVGHSIDRKVNNISW